MMAQRLRRWANIKTTLDRQPAWISPLSGIRSAVVHAFWIVVAGSIRALVGQVPFIMHVESMVRSVHTHICQIHPYKYIFVVLDKKVPINSLNTDSQEW